MPGFEIIGEEEEKDFDTNSMISEKAFIKWSNLKKNLPSSAA
jgi:hypothetical protein